MALKNKTTKSKQIQIDLNNSGVKFDQEKPKMSLVPNLALEEVAKVMTYGAKKYASYNWMSGFDWTRLSDAAMRHINAFNAGKDIDPESGLSHLAHAACCVMMLFDTTKLYPERDNRWYGWKEFNERALLRKKDVLVKQKKARKIKNS